MTGKRCLIGWAGYTFDHMLGMSAHIAGSALMVVSVFVGAWLLLNGSSAEPVEA
jgi:hypothetical protein